MIPFDPTETGSTPYTPDTPEVRAIATRHVEGGMNIAQDIQAEAERLCKHFNSAWVYHLDQDDVNVLWEKNRLWDFDDRDTPPTAREVNLHYLDGFGHDSINCIYCVDAKAKRMGYDNTECQHCEGTGEIWGTKSEKFLCDSWERIEPPIGDGYQIWENVTEGSPISPVFDSLDSMVEWLVREGYTESAARNFVAGGYAPSGALINGYFLEDIESLG